MHHHSKRTAASVSIHTYTDILTHAQNIAYVHASIYTTIYTYMLTHSQNIRIDMYLDIEAHNTPFKERNVIRPFAAQIEDEVFATVSCLEEPHYFIDRVAVVGFSSDGGQRHGYQRRCYVPICMCVYVYVCMYVYVSNVSVRHRE
jgi:hypothetical protein